MANHYRLVKTNCSRLLSMFAFMTNISKLSTLKLATKSYLTRIM